LVPKYSAKRRQPTTQGHEAAGKFAAAIVNPEAKKRLQSTTGAAKRPAKATRKSIWLILTQIRSCGTCGYGQKGGMGTAGFCLGRPNAIESEAGTVVRL
jgi:hypothetical protein